MPGSTVHFDCELHFFARCIEDEPMSRNLNRVLQREGRHPRSPEDLQAPPDLEFALASVRQECDELPKRSPSSQAGSTFQLGEELTR